MKTKKQAVEEYLKRAYYLNEDIKDISKQGFLAGIDFAEQWYDITDTPKNSITVILKQDEETIEGLMVYYGIGFYDKGVWTYLTENVKGIKFMPNYYRPLNI